MATTMERGGFGASGVVGEEAEEAQNGTLVAETDKAFVVVMTLVYVVIFVVGIVANSLVIFCVLRSRSMLTATTLYMLNLAVADVLFLLALIFFLPSFVMQKWPFESVCCATFFGLTAVNWYASVFTLTAMSVERYRGTQTSISFRQYALCQAKVLCVVIWVLAIGAMSPVLVFSRAGRDEDDPADADTSCRIKFPNLIMGVDSSTVFTVYSFVIGFAIPIAVTTYFNILLLAQLHWFKVRTHAKTRRRRANQKLTSLVLCISFMYIVCWAPYWCFQLLIILVDDVDLGSSVGVGVQLLTYVNSMCNPILYVSLSEKFRSRLRSLFQRFRDSFLTAIVQL